MMVQFKNDIGINREVKIGFSWTSFFFGGFPFLFRGMPVHGLGWIFLAIITFGISNLVLCFIINKQTAVHYLENGYKPMGSNWDVAASAWGINLPQQENIEPISSTESNVEQSPSPTYETETKVVASPLPLILMGGAAMFASILTQLFIKDFFDWELFQWVNMPLMILQFGIFIWAAIEYLSKNEHKILAISLMTISFLVSRGYFL